jgi:eukaryotic-like serine/threonine-protein kinase
MALCPYCSNEIDDGARFCGVCGRPITQTAGAAVAARAAAEASGSFPSPPPSAVPTQVPASPSASTSGSAPAPAPVPAPAPAARPAPAAATRPGGGGAPAAATRPGGGASAARPAPSPPGGVAPVLRGPTQPLENLIGRTLNHRYLVEDKIGEGGFGAVFRGKQIATGREVALKILHPHNVHDETIVARFRREAEACSKLRDPHTVTTYDFDETPDGILYLAMELLRGRALHHLQKADGPLGATRVLRIMDQVAASLSEAHANGIVHRDMKPENVFIEQRGGEDHVKVLDFGIAKVMSDDRQVPALTAVGQTLGTLEFMSPEQLRGQKLDGRSDIYALGMMAYEMLTGKLPFQSAKTPIDIINFHMKQEAPPPSRLADHLAIPAAVDAIILKMVQKDRENRFADANALRDEIARAQRSLDRTPDKFEVYRLLGVIGTVVIVVATLVYFLHR